MKISAHQTSEGQGTQQPFPPLLSFFWRFWENPDPFLNPSNSREQEGRIQHPWDCHPTNKSGSNPQIIKPHTGGKEEVGRVTSHSCDTPTCSSFAIPDAQQDKLTVFRQLVAARRWLCCLHLARVPALWMEIMEIPGFDI